MSDRLLFSPLTIRGVELLRYGHQVPFSDDLRRHAEIMTITVGLRADQAEQILPDDQADVIAVGRESLNNPDCPLDAALKLRLRLLSVTVPPQFGWGLGTRAKRGFGTKPSTWQNGLNDTRKVL